MCVRVSGNVLARAFEFMRVRTCVRPSPSHARARVFVCVCVYVCVYVCVCVCALAFARTCALVVYILSFSSHISNTHFPF